ncbi:MAG: hypothetical protein QXR89_01445 [Candidatus Bathyarchaeia archaeon]
MKTKTKLTAKKSRKRNIAIAVTLTIITLIIIASAIHQQAKKEANPPKEDPNKYFQFLSAEAQGEKIAGSATALKIQYLTFILKPVMGDAHDVVIFAEGMTNPGDYWYGEIKNGTETRIEIQFSSPIRVTKQPGDLYLLEIEIYSSETLRGKHTFQMKIDEEIGNYVFLKEKEE